MSYEAERSTAVGHGSENTIADASMGAMFVALALMPNRRTERNKVLLKLMRMRSRSTSEMHRAVCTSVISLIKARRGTP
jgi:hypothetical protein